MDLNTIVALDQIVEKRSAIESLIQNANITLTNGNEWLWNRPECESKNICVFKWQTMDNDTKLIESKDNLKMETKKNANL
ncbi:hypothetical protein GCM10011418_15940 [Sphingobacterium alkalisoli]|nr:hypothetical protein GCM10011418_15940 [Sphingobacterium alkalisoli]